MVALVVWVARIDRTVPRFLCPVVLCEKRASEDPIFFGTIPAQHTRSAHHQRNVDVNIYGYHNKVPLTSPWVERVGGLSVLRGIRGADFYILMARINLIYGF